MVPADQSASAATTRPVVRSTSGWNHTASSARSRACLRSLSISRRAVTAARRSSLKTETRSRPPSLATYIAVSASRRRSPARLDAVATATPMLAVEKSSPSVIENGASERLDESPGGADGLGGLVQVAHDHDELVTAGASDQVAAADGADDALRGGLQQGVADPVAE